MYIIHYVCYKQQTKLLLQMFSNFFFEYIEIKITPEETHKIVISIRLRKMSPERLIRTVGPALPLLNCLDEKMKEM